MILYSFNWVTFKFPICGPNNRILFQNPSHKRLNDLGSENSEVWHLLKPNIFENVYTIYSMYSWKHKLCEKSILRSKNS